MVYTDELISDELSVLAWHPVVWAGMQFEDMVIEARKLSRISMRNKRAEISMSKAYSFRDSRERCNGVIFFAVDSFVIAIANSWFTDEYQSRAPDSSFPLPFYKIPVDILALLDKGRQKGNRAADARRELAAFVLDEFMQHNLAKVGG